MASLGWLVDRLPAVARSRAQVLSYRANWQRDGDGVLASQRAGDDRPLWVVLGDSAAQAVGASSYDSGYVGRLRTHLAAASGQEWKVLNLSVSGARTTDVLAQLERWQHFGLECDLLSAVVGANDLTHTPVPQHIADVRALFARLPPAAVVATLPRGWKPAKAVAVDAVIRAEGAARHLRIAELANWTGPPYRGMYADGFHPNDRGYARWAGALAAALELPPCR